MLHILSQMSIYGILDIGGGGIGGGWGREGVGLVAASLIATAKTPILSAPCVTRSNSLWQTDRKSNT